VFVGTQSTVLKGFRGSLLCECSAVAEGSRETIRPVLWYCEGRLCRAKIIVISPLVN
jgi:hypothetical protein